MRKIEYIEHEGKKYTFKKPIEYIVKHIRAPLSNKSDDWQETADRWIVLINNQSFDYYTGAGHRKKNGGFNMHAGNMTLQTALSHYRPSYWPNFSDPVAPGIKDVLYSLCMDADALEYSFSDWCDNLGYSDDSMKHKAIYDACIENAHKLRKAGINPLDDDLREFLQNY